MSQRDWEAEGMLEGLDGKAREDRIRLLDDLYEDGCQIDELRKAIDEHRLMFLPVERALGDEHVYTRREIAEKSGVDYDFMTLQWQALGLPATEPDEVHYSERDLEAAKRLKGFLDAGIPPEGVIDMARVLGQAMARVAEASRFLVARSFVSAGATEYDIVQQTRVAKPLTDLMEPTLAHVFGLQLVEQLRHEALDQLQMEEGSVGQREVTVCFADLVGWTELSEEAGDETIGSVADRLGSLTTDMLRPPVRVVKMIGDAAMLVSPEEGPLLELALDMVDAAEADPDFPQLRAGLASGRALSRWGDWYGRPVNLASRVCSRARPGSVLVTESVMDACDENAYRFSAAGEKRLKGIGQVPLWRVRRASDA